MIRALIVENENKHLQLLCELLAASAHEVDVVATSTTVADAYNKIRTLKPELVFLDIDLDSGDNGFDLLRMFDRPDFAVIFTTQHNNTDNAISALRACAIDFLPKPLHALELEAALKRYDAITNIDQARSLRDNIATDSSHVTTIWIKSTDGKTKIDTVNVLYCESENVYTHFHLLEPVSRRVKYVSSEKIKDWERSLERSEIHRVHNQYLVNFSYVEKYTAKLSGSAALKLKTGVEIPVSKSRKDEVKKLLRLRK